MDREDQRHGQPSRRDYGTAANDIWAVGDLGTVLHWNGTAWTSSNPGTTTTNFAAVWASSATDVWIVGDLGAIRHYNGTAWSASTSGTVQKLGDIWGSGPNDVWASGATGTLVHWNGTMWAVSTLNTPLVGAAHASLNGLRGTGPNDIWVTADLGGLFHYDGTAWTPSSSGSVNNLAAVWPIAGGTPDAWIVGDFATILRHN